MAIGSMVGEQVARTLDRKVVRNVGAGAAQAIVAPAADRAMISQGAAGFEGSLQRLKASMAADGPNYSRHEAESQVRTTGQALALASTFADAFEGLLAKSEALRHPGAVARVSDVLKYLGHPDGSPFVRYHPGDELARIGSLKELFQDFKTGSTGYRRMMLERWMTAASTGSARGCERAAALATPGNGRQVGEGIARIQARMEALAEAGMPGGGVGNLSGSDPNLVRVAAAKERAFKLGG